jgi:hypothetical protein
MDGLGQVGEVALGGLFGTRRKRGWPGRTFTREAPAGAFTASDWAGALMGLRQSA